MLLYRFLFNLYNSNYLWLKGIVTIILLRFSTAIIFIKRMIFIGINTLHKIVHDTFYLLSCSEMMNKK